jgi:flagellar motor switch protein FliM
MDDENLSKAEVESLLIAKQSHAVAPASQRAQVRPYDFRRPSRRQEDLRRALEALHEAFARSFGAALSAQLRATVEVKLASVLQPTSSEFFSSLENPTSLNILRAAPLDGNLVVEFHPSILFPLIDRLLGGGKESGPVVRRPLTEIEQRLASRIMALLLQELQRAWEPVTPLTLSVERVESNPQLLQITPPADAVIVLAFEAAMGEARGPIKLCIPLTALECVLAKLLGTGGAKPNQSGATAHTRAIIGRQLDGSLVDIVVTVAETRLSAADLLGLGVGDIITTDKDIHAPLDVAVQGLIKFQATGGAHQGSKAIRIETAPAAPVPENAAQQAASTAGSLS